jgi:hypothetical protein
MNGNKDYRQVTNMNPSRLAKLENKMEETEAAINDKFNEIDLKYNNLKNELVGYFKKYEEEKLKNNNYSEKLNNFKLYLEEVFIRYDNDIQEFTNNITKSLSEKLISVEQEIILNNEEYKKNCTYLLSVASQEVIDINNFIENESNKREQFFSELLKEVESEFESIHKNLGDLNEKNEELKATLSATLEDIINRITTQIEKEKSSRVKFEENIFSILEETCNQLSM